MYQGDNTTNHSVALLYVKKVPKDPTRTAVPMVKNVKRPTILLPREQARNTPVRSNQVHHSEVNSLVELSTKERNAGW